MRNKKEFTGYWWPPGDEPVGGTAVFDPEDGIKLELFEMISEGSLPGENISFNRIFGNTTNGDQVTLTDCYSTGSSVSFGGQSLSTESYRAKTLIIGDHLTKSETQFDRFRASYPLLYQWSNLSGLTRGFSKDDEGGIDEVNITYSPPPKKEARVEKESVNILTNGNISTSRSGELSINETTYLEVSSDERNKGITEIFDEVDRWQEFLTLATDENIGVEEVLAYKDGESIEGRPQEFEIIYQTSKGSEYPEKLHPSAATFMMEDIEEVFPQIVRNWINLSDEYSSVYELYFAVVYQDKMYLDNQYMMLMTALNLLYQQRFDHEYVDDQELAQITQNLITAIPEGTDEEFKAYLREDVLPSANQHSLRKRLSVIAEEYSSVLESLPWDFVEEIDNLIQVHDYSVGRSSELQQAEPRWLHQKTLLLSAMLETIILMDLGIPKDDVRESISEKYEIPRYYGDSE